MIIPGVTEALNGESGVNTIRGHHGDLVTAFSYIPQAGWALVLEENWQEIATPFLSTTQSAPLILVPLLVLALVALLFGARQIVQPLQKLEVKAASLAHGDFDAIREPVGGIAEIRNLQNALKRHRGRFGIRPGCAAQLHWRHHRWGGERTPRSGARAA